MSANRLIYDKCAFNQQVDSSVKPLEYVLDNTAVVHCNPCRIMDGTTGGNQVSLVNGGISAQIDLESKLFGISSGPTNKCDLTHDKITADTSHLKTCKLYEKNSNGFEKGKQVQQRNLVTTCEQLNNSNNSNN